VNSATDTIAFKIKRVGQQAEIISADACTTEGPPPAKYVFRKNGAIVFELFVYALESDPKPILGRYEGQLNLWDTGSPVET
jgi:hypothetical protein